jgi:aldose 1-epimerase
MLSIKRTFICNHDNDSSIYEYSLSNGSITVKILNYGCTISSIVTPDKNNNYEEIALCHKDIDDILINKNSRYFGSIVGRVANRISNGEFSINDNKYKIPINNGINSLHGGINGFDKKIFIVSSSNGIKIDDNGITIKFNYLSKDNEEGYPGNLNVIISYNLSLSNDLTITYLCNTDKATLVNLTNHTYFNLSGNYKEKIYNHKLKLNCNYYLPNNENQIPVGNKEDVFNTLFDYTVPNQYLSYERLLPIDSGGRAGIDNNFIINNYNHIGKIKSNDDIFQLDSNYLPDLELLPVATITDEKSGRLLNITSSMPGVQIYTSNWLSLDENDYPYTQHNGVCFETQYYPDSCNKYLSNPDGI